MMNKSAVKALAIFLLTCPLLTCPAILQAQISNATLVGTVTDPSGAVVVAKVEAKNIGTGIARSTTTDANGEYTIPNLPAAHYSVTVTAPGFKVFNATEVELQVAQRHVERRPAGWHSRAGADHYSVCPDDRYIHLFGGAGSESDRR